MSTLHAWARALRGTAEGVFAKRILDVCASAVALVLLSPLMAGAALGVLANVGWPVVFRQRRVGRGGRVFTLYKFRTMREAADAQGRRLADERRLTRFGRILRAISLDELPQLWNVVKGDMSLVGPRPLLPEYVTRYSAFQRRRLEVTPGITGWAQVHGRNSSSWDRKFELDVWYVDHHCFRLDAKILAMTVWQVLRGRGISQPGHATMPEFLGSNAVRGSERAS